MSKITLIPAYGRDYGFKHEFEADLLAGKDFIFSQWGSPWDGKPCNLEQLQAEGVSEVRIRFNLLRKVSTIKLPSKRQETE